MPMEIKGRVWDRHKNVAVLYQLMGSLWEILYLCHLQKRIYVLYIPRFLHINLFKQQGVIMAMIIW
jgi:hypothetical protein